MTVENWPEGLSPAADSLWLDLVNIASAWTDWPQQIVEHLKKYGKDAPAAAELKKHHLLYWTDMDPDKPDEEPHWVLTKRAIKLIKAKLGVTTKKLKVHRPSEPELFDVEMVVKTRYRLVGIRARSPFAAEAKAETMMLPDLLRSALGGVHLQSIDQDVLSVSKSVMEKK